MSVTHTEDLYPGYQGRTFACPVCGRTMTQWSSISQAAD